MEELVNGTGAALLRIDGTAGRIHPQVEALLRSGALGCIEALEVWVPYNERVGDAAELAPLMRSSDLTSLKRLSLRDVNANPIIGALTSNPALGVLDELSLVQGMLTAQSLEVIGSSEALSAVQSLVLEGNGFGDEGVLELASSGFSRLTSLSVCLEGVTSRALPLLAEAGFMDTLRDLQLAENPLGPEGARFLASSPAFAKLDRLNVEECNVGLGAGIDALCNSTTLSPSIVSEYRSLVASDAWIHLA